MLHSFAFPNDLLSVMIAAWRLDHSLCSSTSTVETDPMAPSEERIEDILPKFSDDSESQKQALNKIHRLSSITKEVQLCLEKWPVLIPVLIDLRTNWKSTWSQEVEELRLTIILNLSVHRSNRVILAGVTQLPDALKKIAYNAHKLGCPKSALAKVASIVANLSEFGIFRKGILNIGGMEMLRDILKIENVIVRKEAITAICGLCAAQEGKDRAKSCHVADFLVECLTITDEALILLDCLQKDETYLAHKLCDKVVELVNVIMTYQETEPIARKAICSAISLVYDIVQQDVRKMEEVKNLEDFKTRLEELSPDILPLQAMLQAEMIIGMLERPPAPPRQVRS
jgi:hypothetical protein